MNDEHDENKDMTCGCSCENCTNGDHDQCASGTCAWKGKVTTNDMGGDE